MRRAAVNVRVAVLASVCAAGVAAIAITSASASTSAGFTTQAVTESRTTQVWMAGQQQAAQRFVDAVSTPGSPAYHRFLRPDAYTRRFGASAAQVKAVESYLASKGFTQVRASVSDDYVSGVGRNDRELTFPASISRYVLAVTGPNGPKAAAKVEAKVEADDTATASTSGSASAAAPVCSHYWAQHTATISPAFDGLTEAATVVCGYSAKQIRAAYGLTSADTGKGKTIALIEVGAPYDQLAALTDYAKANGLPAPRHGQYRQETVGQGASDSACPNGAFSESALDSEAAYAMAPAASQLMVEGDDCDNNDDGGQALLDAMLAPLTGHGSSASAAIESVSYNLNSSVPSSLWKIGHAIALRAAAEGVSLLIASGDTPGAEESSSDPDVTAVGGTTLGLGADGQRAFETGWSTAFGERAGASGSWHSAGILGGAGGGVSAVYGEPSYQKGVVPSSMARGKAGKPGRAVPDISADADPYSGMLMGLIITGSNGKPRPYTPFLGGGTSQATPLIAGMIADAEQGQPRDFGFLNPLLYSLAGRLAYHDARPLGSSDPQVDRAIYTRGLTHLNNKFAEGYLVGVTDAQRVSGTGQVTAPGYDTMTGLGTPNGSAFIDELRSGK